jgi:hypothetical protein
VILKLWFGDILLEGTFDELQEFFQILLRQAILEAGAISNPS